MIANTEQTLRQEGVSHAAIATVIADLRSRQSGTATPIQRNLIAEHTEGASTAGNEEASDANTSARSDKRSRHT